MKSFTLTSLLLLFFFLFSIFTLDTYSADKSAASKLNNYNQKFIKSFNTNYSNFINGNSVLIKDDIDYLKFLEIWHKTTNSKNSVELVEEQILSAKSYIDWTFGHTLNHYKPLIYRSNDVYEALPFFASRTLSKEEISYYDKALRVSLKSAFILKKYIASIDKLSEEDLILIQKYLSHSSIYNIAN